MAYLDELGKRSDGLPMREAAAERQAHAGQVLSRRIDRHDKDTARLIVAEWRRLSGYQHGKTWSVTGGLVVQKR